MAYCGKDTGETMPVEKISTQQLRFVWYGRQRLGVVS